MEEFEDSCENCWWHFGIHGGSCHNPQREEMDNQNNDVEACGWFEPKLSNSDNEQEKWEAFQNEWN